MPAGHAQPVPHSSTAAGRRDASGEREATAARARATRSGEAEVVDLRSLTGIACPCGTARRAFGDRDDLPATVHWTEISKTARTHYHRRLTETYVIVQCAPDAAMELDGVLHPVQPGTAILIPPGVRHRAVGEMQVVIFCTPKFEPSDEHFD